MKKLVTLLLSLALVLSLAEAAELLPEYSICWADCWEL